jgi:hypothetical protein
VKSVVYKMRPYAAYQVHSILQTNTDSCTKMFRYKMVNYKKSIVTEGFEFAEVLVAFIIKQMACSLLTNRNQLFCMIYGRGSQLNEKCAH